MTAQPGTYLGLLAGWVVLQPVKELRRNEGVEICTADQMVQRQCHSCTRLDTKKITYWQDHQEGIAIYWYQT